MELGRVFDHVVGRQWFGLDVGVVTVFRSDAVGPDFGTGAPTRSSLTSDHMSSGQSRPE